jgi:mannose-6-phosphate isomerase-like protein (cupin superfamily)
VKPIVIGPDGGELVQGDTRIHRILAVLPELEVIELTFGPEFEGVPAHSHDDHVDSFYVLEGEAEFVFGDEVIRAGPGTYVAAPVGAVHGFRNPGPDDLRMLNIHGPNTGFAERLKQA